jgi:hypothetical protein
MSIESARQWANDLNYMARRAGQLVRFEVQGISGSLNAYCVANESSSQQLNERQCQAVFASLVRALA